MATGRAVVGVFHRTAEAFEALARLDEEGLAPDHVGLVADDPELAGEVASHDRARVGALGGFLLGVLVSVVFVAMVGADALSALPGVVLGAIAVTFGLAFIGVVFGRGLVVRTAHHGAYERAVREGGAIVTVECTGTECEHARHVLEDAAAEQIVDEGAPAD
ncbi:MAG TPA: hypothetical protein VJQ09_02285 [Candidatus Limnocylindria bacterium]|nr:hypothetical protein [Candidatus Limnocylindria bacterium]